MTVIGWKPVEAYNPNAYLVALNAKSNPLSNVADALSGLGDLGIKYADRAKNEFDLRTKIAEQEQKQIQARESIVGNQYLADNSELVQSFLNRASSGKPEDISSVLTDISKLPIERGIRNHLYNTVVKHAENMLNNQKGLASINLQTQQANLANAHAQHTLAQKDTEDALRAGREYQLGLQNRLGEANLYSPERMVHIRKLWDTFTSNPKFLDEWRKVTTQNPVERYKEFLRINPSADGQISYNDFILLDQSLTVNMVPQDLQGRSTVVTQNIARQAPALQEQVFNSFSFPFYVGHALKPNFDPSTEGINAIYGNTIAQSKNQTVTQQRISDAAGGLKTEVEKFFKKIDEDKTLSASEKAQYKAVLNNPTTRLIAVHSILGHLTNTDSFANWFLGEETATKPDWHYKEKEAYEDFKKNHAMWQGKEPLLRPLFGTNGLLTKEHFDAVQGRAVTRSVQNKEDYQTALEAEMTADLNQFFNPESEHGQRYTSEQQNRIRRAYAEAFGSNPLSSVNLFADSLDPYPEASRAFANHNEIATFSPNQTTQGLIQIDQATADYNKAIQQIKKQANSPDVTPKDKRAYQTRLEQIYANQDKLAETKRILLQHDTRSRKTNPTLYNETIDKMLLVGSPKADKNYSSADLEKILIDGLVKNQTDIQKYSSRLEPNDPFTPTGVSETEYALKQRPIDFLQIFDKKEQELSQQIQVLHNKQNTQGLISPEEQQLNEYTTQLKQLWKIKDNVIKRANSQLKKAKLKEIIID